MRVLAEGRPVDLPDTTFVADGGEARVHALGGLAYKVLHQPTDPARLRALQALAVPGAVLPLELLFDADGHCLGHTMRYLPDHVPWTRLLSRTYRSQHGIDPTRALGLVERLRDRLHAVHAAGAQVVDLHAGNLLVDPTLRDPVLIDTSSWQLPGFPATAIQDAVRDRHATGFDEGTDWFAFAVVAAQTLLGVHPYRGTHPVVKGLDARMQQRLSILRAEVSVPAVAWSPDVLPRPWRAWLASVLDGDHRGPPPGGDGVVRWRPAPAPTSRHVTLVELARHRDPIRGAVEHGARTFPWTDPALVVAVLTEEGVAVGARRTGQGLALTDLDSGTPVACDLRLDAVAALGTSLVARSGARLLQLDLPRLGGRVTALPRLLATVLPEASHLFDGLVVEDLLGRCHLRLLAPGRCETLAVPALDGAEVVAAVHRRGVVALVARRGTRLDRYVIRARGAQREVLHTPDVGSADLDLVVLPQGVVVLRVDGRLELLRTRPGDESRKLVDDPAFVEGRLVALGHQLGLLRGGVLYRASLDSASARAS